jgi:hypothetical protein
MTHGNGSAPGSVYGIPQWTPYINQTRKEGNMTIEERLAVIETGQQHMMAMMEEIKIKMDSMHYVTQEACAAQCKLYKMQFENLRAWCEDQLLVMQKDINGIRKDLNGFSKKTEEMRKTSSNRFFGILSAVVTIMIIELARIIFEGGK